MNIKATNVTLSISGRNILSNVSLLAEGGKMTALSGKSGSGKTTLLNCLGLIHPIDSGEILVDNLNATNWRGQIAPVFGVIPHRLSIKITESLMMKRFHSMYPLKSSEAINGRSAKFWKGLDWEDEKKIWQWCCQAEKNNAWALRVRCIKKRLSSLRMSQQPPWMKPTDSSLFRC